MSENNKNNLKEQIKQTEIAVTGVAEFVEDKARFFAPPSSEAMPIPRPPEAEQPFKDQELAKSIASESESETDEIQDAWLASLETKTATLTKCLEDIQRSLNTLSQNVDSLEADAKIKNAEAEGKTTDNVLRKQMADKTYWFMVVWCLFIGSLILGYVIACEGKPPTEFMLGLLGTCTISIIGLVGFVVSGLFKAPEKKEQK